MWNRCRDSHQFGQKIHGNKRALVDVGSGEFMFRVNEDEVMFDACKSMKQPSDIHVVSMFDVIR